MENFYIKEVSIISQNKLNDYQEILKNIDNVKRNLQKHYNNFQFIQDEKLIDYYTYKIKSEEAKYDYLVSEAKKIEEKRGKNS